MLGVRTQQIAHALLFVGPEGYGSLPLALAYAQFLNCQQRADDDSCGICNACRKMQKLIHPDLHITFPTFKAKSGSEHPALSADFYPQFRSALLENPYLSFDDWQSHINAENKQLNISAEECRSILRKLQLHAFEGPFKILIIWQADRLGKEGNLLLKLLEEPPPMTTLMLLATQTAALLPTIVSRCQLFGMPPIEESDLVAALQRNEALNAVQRAEIARSCEGNYRDALQMAVATANPVFRLHEQWWKAVCATDAQELIVWVEQVCNLNREQQKMLLRFASAQVRQSLRACYPTMNQANERATEVRLHLSIDQWYRLAALFDQAHQLLERNVNSKILWLNTSLKVQHLMAPHSDA